MPIHTEFISGLLNDFANLKVLKVNSLNLKIFDLSQSAKIAPKAKRFSETFDTVNFILNSEILFWIFLIYLLLCVPVFLGNKYSKGRWTKRLFSSLH